MTADQVIRILRLRSHMKNRMLFSKSNDVLDELKNIPVRLKQIPINPGDLIILAIGIIIPVFRAAKLIPRPEAGVFPDLETAVKRQFSNCFSAHLHYFLFFVSDLPRRSSRYDYNPFRHGYFLHWLRYVSSHRTPCPSW